MYISNNFIICCCLSTSSKITYPVKRLESVNTSKSFKQAKNLRKQNFEEEESQLKHTNLRNKITVGICQQQAGVYTYMYEYLHAEHVSYQRIFNIF